LCEVGLNLKVLFLCSPGCLVLLASAQARSAAAQAGVRQPFLVESAGCSRCLSLRSAKRSLRFDFAFWASLPHHRGEGGPSPVALSPGVSEKGPTTGLEQATFAVVFVYRRWGGGRSLATCANAAGCKELKCLGPSCSTSALRSWFVHLLCPVHVPKFVLRQAPVFAAN